VLTIDCGCSKLVDCSFGDCILLPTYCHYSYSEQCITQVYLVVCDQIKSVGLSVILFLLSEPESAIRRITIRQVSGSCDILDSQMTRSATMTVIWADKTDVDAFIDVVGMHDCDCSIVDVVGTHDCDCSINMNLLNNKETRGLWRLEPI
jgi:hypothetical protein